MSLLALGAAAVAAAGFLAGRRWERSAREREPYRSLFEEAPVAYHEIGRAGLVERVNRAECRLLGLEADQITGRPVWDLVAPEERELSRLSVMEKLRAESALPPFRREYLGAGGRRICCEVHETYIRGRRGGIAGIRSLLIDVTERRRAEEDLLRIRKAVESTLDAVGILDAAGRAVYINPSAEALLGCSLDSLNGPAGVRCLFAGPEEGDDVVGTADDARELGHGPLPRGVRAGARPPGSGGGRAGHDGAGHAGDLPEAHA